MMENPRHPACERRSLASAVLVIACLFALTACETATIGGLGGSAEQRAERMTENGEHAAAASAYMGLAVDAVGSERDRYTLLAVERYLDAGDVARARSAFSNVARQETGSLAALWSTNRAAFHLYNGEADDALGLLEPLSLQPLTQRDRLRVEALRADAWIQKQDPARAVELMTQRETWVADRRGIERNRNRLWQGLLLSSPATLREASELALDPVVRAGPRESTGDIQGRARCR